MPDVAENTRIVGQSDDLYRIALIGRTVAHYTALNRVWLVTSS